jgi:hypothetical protein
MTEHHGPALDHSGCDIPAAAASDDTQVGVTNPDGYNSVFELSASTGEVVPARRSRTGSRGGALRARGGDLASPASG